MKVNIINGEGGDFVILILEWVSCRSAGLHSERDWP